MERQSALDHLKQGSAISLSINLGFDAQFAENFLHGI